MDNVKFFRLTSGEEVVARVKDDKHGWTIENPVLLVPMGKGNLGLMPWLPYTETDDMVLPASFVHLVLTPKPEMVTNYIEATSNLVVPDRNISKGPVGNLKLITE